MGMTVRLSDGRVTVTVEGLSARTKQDVTVGPDEPAEPEAEPERCTPERRTCRLPKQGWCSKAIPGANYVCSREPGHKGRCIACCPEEGKHNLAIAAPEPPAVEPASGPDLRLIERLISEIKSRTFRGGTNYVLCEQIQKELTK